MTGRAPRDTKLRLSVAVPTAPRPQGQHPLLPVLVTPLKAIPRINQAAWAQELSTGQPFVRTHATAAILISTRLSDTWHTLL